jgi:hypothetical protein
LQSHNSINDEASRLQQAENADIGITPQFEGARKRHVDAVTATTGPQLTTATSTAAATAMPMPMAGLAALEAAAKAASSSSGSNSLSASPTMFLTAGGGISGSGKRQRV